jgi:hypothetical protein
MFLESLGNATLHNGTLRIEAKILGGDGKEQTAGHLLIPARQAGHVAQQLTKILTELKRVIDETAANNPKQPN